jgi:hypothetical protein
MPFSLASSTRRRRCRRSSLASTRDRATSATGPTKLMLRWAFRICIDFDIKKISMILGCAMTQVADDRELRRYFLELERRRFVDEFCRQMRWSGYNFTRTMVETICSRATWKRLTKEIEALR